MNRMSGSGFVTRIVAGPYLKYLGLTLVLAWHSCLWFVPTTWPGTFLLDDRVTFSWLTALAGTVVTVGLLAVVLGRTGHLPPHRGLPVAAGAVGCAATLLATLGAPVTGRGVTIGASALAGMSAGLLWVLWGERHACQRSGFGMRHIAPVYGITMLVSIGIAYFAPGVISPVVVSLMPLLSGLLLALSWTRAPVQPFPAVLPRKTGLQGLFTIVTVGFISFVAAVASYFTVAIVPWVDLDGVGRSFTMGVAIGAVFVMAIGVVQRMLPWHPTVFRFFPWLLFFAIIACLMCALGARDDFAAFLLALAVSSAFEVLLIMYMARLTLAGYVPAATAFGVSAVAIRLGILLGNALALTYERTSDWLQMLTAPTSMIFAAILAGLLIPLVRQEYTINDLARSPQAASEWTTMVERTAEEFRLSERETQIVSMLGHGYTAAAVAEKLVISVHTVNTHIQHIYDKMGIHKRAELLDYLNMH
ncbi:MAG: helix-turn-helix transcriptional regulator [Propionibacteriaceae bacterium]|nr:helix-turn-helix transcriptional regulator [Propionibacteriaceae bacterium]